MSPVEARISWQFVPRPWQAAVQRGFKRFNVVVVHRRGGKTTLALITLLTEALRCPFKYPYEPPGRYAYVAPFRGQAKRNIWNELLRWCSRLPDVKVDRSELTVTLQNGAQIVVLGADLPDSLRGPYLDGLVLDEVAQMKREAWTEVLLPQLADREGWVLMIGTPKGVNLFSELYFGAVNDPDNWFTTRLTWRDTAAIRLTEIERFRSMMTDEEFRQEFECDFSASAINALFSMDEVHDSMLRELPVSAFQFAPKTLGVDVARGGGAESVCFPRQGLMTWMPSAQRGTDTQAVVNMIGKYVRSWEPDFVLIDATGGYGAGVYDLALRAFPGVTMIPVLASSSAADPRYLNKRAEMWWEMQKWLRLGGCLPNSSRLVQDLCAPTYKHNTAGRLVLESKDDLAARDIPSPDYADALAQTFAVDLSHHRPQNRHRRAQAYREPHARLRRTA